MLTVYSEDHRQHFPKHELFKGEFVTPFEKPERVDAVLNRVKAVALGEVIAPRDFGMAPLLRVHAPNFVTYLQTAWMQWIALGRDHDILPFVFPALGFRKAEPQHIDGKVGFFAFDTGAPISAHTWQAVQSAANCAVTAQKHLSDGARAAFALCRPPGHHAGSDFVGGYCYINNAAVAAQAFLDDGAQRVAILDVDYHHGNGTQEIFYRRSDVLYISIHGHPEREYPYFLGYADEIGEAAGLGYNHNYPLHDGATYEQWGDAMAHACKKILAYAPDALVVSLGVDTFEADPISRFKLKSEDYLRMGRTIGQLRVQTLFVMEGGYAVGAVGINTVNVLQGFETTAI
jgi:acetoin utilization deacetylase AcuC-like enzyme